ncbi:MAG: HPr family phosphocarrier protein [Velocimicrobium sp.]
MKKFTYTITDEIGIHARPAGLIVKEAKQFNSTMTLICKEKRADLTRLMAIMSLGVRRGDEVIIEIEGSDEAQAAAAMKTFFNENL